METLHEGYQKIVFWSFCWLNVYLYLCTGLEIGDAAGDYGLTGIEMDGVEGPVAEGAAKEDEEEEEEDEKDDDDENKSRISRKKARKIFLAKKFFK